MKAFWPLLALASLVALLSGCGTRNWKEEVQLHDGQRTVVERWAWLGNPLDRELPDLSPSGPVVGHGIRIPKPGRLMPVLWETDRTLSPLAIGYRGDTIYLAASPRYCWAYDRYGRPVPPYVFFKHEGKEWQRIPVEEFPEEISTANLLVGSWPREVASGEISADRVAKLNRQLSAGLRTIYRSGTKGWETCLRELRAGWHKTNPGRD